MASSGFRLSPAHPAEWRTADHRSGSGPWSRRRFGALLFGAASGLVLGERRAAAFEQSGAFQPRLLRAGGARLDSAREQGPSSWAWELVKRTSAPARLRVEDVAADEHRLLAEPVVVWAGHDELQPLSRQERGGLERFVRLGGVIVVDDLSPERGAFRSSARRELAALLPDLPIVKLGAQARKGVLAHVVYKAFYLLERPYGRVQGPPEVEGMMSGKNLRVLFLEHDLLGALARGSEEQWTLPVEPGGEEQRQRAIRFAVNIAMFVLCSNYKDDQVHAQELMRRRGR